MTSRRPPDILRKSHAHSEGKTRARDRRDLRRALDESVDSQAQERGLLIDLDGVVYRGDEAIPGATDTLRWIEDQRIPHLYLTNTTSRSRAAVVAKLAGFGIDVRGDDILAPAPAAAAWLRARGMTRLLALVPAATIEEFADFEILAAADVDADADVAVDAVVVGDLGRAFSFDVLNTAFRCLMREPRPLLVALGMTRYWHASDGLRLDTAPFVTALAHASGVEPVVLGKPARAFFEAALARLGVEAGAALMIGDDIRTDIAGARDAGIDGILVRTGKFRSGDLTLGISPRLVIDSLAELPGVWTEIDRPT